VLRPVRLVIFDLDGTLTEPYLDFDRIRAEIGLGPGPILEAMAHMSSEMRARAEAVLRRHEAEAAANSRLQEGAARVLGELKRRGICTAVLTRNSRISVEQVARKHGLVFDCVRTREDGPIKPSPEPVRAACRAMGVRPEETWTVGDHLFDIQAGRAAGATTVLMLGDRAVPDYADQADHVIRRLDELLGLIDRSLAAAPRREPSRRG